MPFSGPPDIIARVLERLGVDARERLAAAARSVDNTVSRIEEIPAYFALYRGGAVDVDERTVLSWLLLEALNECVFHQSPHPLQEDIFNALYDDKIENVDELFYWTDTTDPEPEAWWPITIPLLRYRQARAAREATVDRDTGPRVDDRSQRAVERN